MSIDSTTPLVHIFVRSMGQLADQLPVLKNKIKKDGMIWVSWPKLSSNIKTDITENKIRDFAIDQGLVDVKVCAINETWSGLKLIYKLKDRI
jgi:hypothetical protein